MRYKLDTGDRVGDGSLLAKVASKLKGQLTPLYDSGGLCGYETEKTVVVAKRYVYIQPTAGAIMSIAHHLLLRARDRGKKIVLYLNQYDCFYLGDPGVLLDNVLGYNVKGDEKMVNFRFEHMERI